MRLLSRVCAAVLIRALKQKEKGTVLRFLSFGSPSWTRTNDPPGLRCPASACGNVLPCPLPTAAPSIAPFFSRSERSRSQQFTAMRLLSRVCAAVLIRALKQKEKGTVLRFLSFGSPSWTRTNDPPGLRCPASACGNVLPCPLPTAAPSIAPFFSRSERSRSQQFTAMRLLSRVCAAVLIRALKQKEKGTVLRFLSFGSPSWTRTNDPAVNSRMLSLVSK